ncbi:MAG: complex subunit family protein [Hyphomicrobiales bacterium]|nr:complex subunit family protein [Hyphomicrobiales bacterium]
MRETSDRTGRLVTVFGGSGFIGRHVVRALARDGWRIRVACRRPDLAGHLQPSGRVGQIQPIQANLRYPASVAAAVRGADAVVNLVGILTEMGRQSFDAVQGFGARAVARAAKEAGVRTLVQMSALGADPQSDSGYARSKAAGEAAAFEFFPDANVLRPSIVFGPEDDFFNRFAALARMSPVLPLIGGGETRFQPVYVGDVAQVVALALTGGTTPGATYELGGPEVKSFRELMEFTCATIGRKRLLVPVPFGAAHYMALGTEVANTASLGLFPKLLLTTRDQVRMLQRDNVVSAPAIAEGRTLDGLGIAPEGIASIVPTYLYRFRKTGQFERQRPA